MDAQQGGDFTDLLDKKPTRRASYDGEADGIRTNNVSTDSTLPTFTIDECISHLGNGWFQYKLLILTGGFAMADDMELMLLSFLVPCLKTEWNLQAPYDGAIASVVFIGYLLGAYLWSTLSDRFGRRYIIIGTNIGCAITGSLSGFSPNIITMLIARFFVGFFASGIVASHTLFAEYVPKEARGPSILAKEAISSFGALFSVLCAWLILPSFSWRYYLITLSIPLWILIACSSLIPESARYLLASGDRDEAMACLRQIAHDNGKEMLVGTLEYHGHTQKQRGQLKDLFNKKYRLGTCLLMPIFMISVFSYYGLCFVSERFFDSDKTNQPNLKYWEMTITTLSEIPGLILGAFIIDHVGRKATLVVSFGIFMVCCVVLTTPYVESNVGLSVDCIFTARLVIALAFCIVFVYFSEFYPTAIRATALGFVSSLGRLAGIATSFVAEDCSVRVAMIFYSTSGLIACLCSLLLPYDTTNCDLTDAVVEENSETEMTVPQKKQSLEGHLASET